MSSLVRISTKLTGFGGFLVKKPLKRTLKMTVSAGAKTFKNLKLENCRPNIIKTCPYASHYHLPFTENRGRVSIKEGGRERIQKFIKKYQEIIKILSLMVFSPANILGMQENRGALLPMRGRGAPPY